MFSFLCIAYYSKVFLFFVVLQRPITSPNLFSLSCGFTFYFQSSRFWHYFFWVCLFSHSWRWGILLFFFVFHTRITSPNLFSSSCSCTFYFQSSSFYLIASTEFLCFLFSEGDLYLAALPAERWQRAGVDWHKVLSSRPFPPHIASLRRSSVRR